jgi:hypothetical protein
VKCEMECTKRAKLKISTSGGQVMHLCFRHSFMWIKNLIPQLGRYDFGIYIQQVPVKTPKWRPSPEARHAVTLPEDRAKKDDEDGWDF